MRKYEIPPTLLELLELNRKLNNAGHFYRIFNFYLCEDQMRYFNTPSDCLVFGNTGMDGIHYGILTDYGAVADLEEAWIVCVSPMDFDQPTRVIARNLKEFLSVNRTDSELFYNSFATEQHYLNTKRQWGEEEANSPYRPSEAERLDQERERNEVLDSFELPIIQDGYQYVQSIQEQRRSMITLQTQDGLGVIYPLEEGHSSDIFPVHKDEYLCLDKLQSYLSTALTAEKLGLFRDIQMNFVLSEEEDLQAMIVGEMRKMGLFDEAARIDV
jgi:hypothetical protein